jgi:hypothetical protein
VVRELVGNQRMGPFLAVGFHQSHISHDVTRTPVGDDYALVNQEHPVTDLQDKLQVVRGHQEGLLK